MSILLSWLSPLRAICMAIDGIAFSLLDNAYNIVIELSKAQFMSSDEIKTITDSLYILFGVVAFFRLAMVLITSIIDPEKMNEKGKGLGNIFLRVVGMFILLGITPWLFKQAYIIQGRIVGSDANQNVIFQLFLGDNANIGGHDDSGYNAGKALQNIVLSSLITVDNQYLVNDGAVCKYEDGVLKSSSGSEVSDVNSECGFIPLTCVNNSDGKTCTNKGGYIYDPATCDWGNCQTAVAVYNEMYVNEDMSPNKLSKWVGTSTDLEDEETNEKTEVYVYNYMFIVTSVVGIFITYVIISFAIDIAVRLFELVVLQILSPFFIATFVDPKSSQSGPFKNWLSALGQTYASLFVKLAILALITFFIMFLNQSDLFSSMGDVSGWAKLFVIIGLLIFAKKAPKWISDMIGIKGEGLGGLSIGKKLGGMALAGGLASKALGAGKNLLSKTGRGLVGSAAGMATARLRDKRQQKLDKKEKGLDRKGKKDFKKKYLNDHGGDSSGFKSAWLEHQKNKGYDSKAKRARSLASTASGFGTGFVAGFKSDNLSGTLKSSISASNKWADEQGLGGKTVKERVLSPGKKAYEKIMNKAYGTEADRVEARDELQKSKLRQDMWTEEGLAKLGGMNNGNLAAGMGGFVDATTDKNGMRAVSLKDAYAMVRAKAEGYNAEYVNGQLQITDNNNSQVDVSQYSKEMTDMTNDIGAAQIKDWFIKSQQQVLSEFQSTSQYVVQANQNISNVTKMLNSTIQAKASTVPGVNVDSNTGFISIPGVGKDTTISIGANNSDQSSLDGILAQADQDLQAVESSNITEDEKLAARNKHNAIKGFVEMLKGDPTVVSYNKSLDRANKDLQVNLARQSQISQVFEKIGSEKGLKTYQQKADYVANEQSKIDKQMQALKNNDKKEN